MQLDPFIIDPHLGWILFAIVGIIIGLGKGGLVGISILAVPLMASIFPAAYSVGILLPLLICGDILGIYFYRRSVIYKEVFKALPLVIIGIVSGYLLLKFYPLSNKGLKELIGLIVLFMLLFSEWQKRKNSGTTKAANPVIMIILAFLGGSTSMLANAAGPVMILYLLYLGINKEEFMGVRSWIFLVINLVKVPFHIELGNITVKSITMDIYIVPAIIIGFLIGYKVLKWIPEKAFNFLVKILTIASCLKLLFF